MPGKYTLDEPFALEGASVQVRNIIFARHTSAIPAHSHGSGCWEIHFIPAGRGRLEANGRTYPIEPGTLFVTGPHIEHAQQPAPDDPMQEYCVYLRLRSPEGCPALSALCAAPFWFSQDDGTVHSLMRQLFDELERRRTGYVLSAQLILSHLLIALSRRCEAPGEPSAARPAASTGGPNTLLIEECFLYEYATITLPKLSERLGLSTRQTQRLLRTTYSATFRSMKLDAQLSAAVSLLHDNALSITSIAEQLGFSSPEHFANTFRRRFGMSPRAYRNAQGHK